MNKYTKKKAVIAGAALSMLLAAGLVLAQGAILDMVAQKVITKYQSSSCEQLWQNKGAPKSPEEQRAVQFLRNDPTARQAFIDKVAAPIANKMFECGLLP
jgi:hypothetical protein